MRDPLMPELTVPISNVTAFVRKGEAEDRFSGRVNWKNQSLYKFIDLKLLTRVFRVNNEEEGEAVYLERTFKGYIIFDSEKMILKATQSKPPKRL